MSKNFSSQKSGFTLLETLVAIAIMTVAVGSAFSMAQKSLTSSYYARNQATAYFLAAEGLELVRTVRDNVALYNFANNSTVDWIQPLKNGNCTGQYGCDIDGTSVDLTLTNPGVIVDQGAVMSCDPALNQSASSNGCHLRIKSLGENKSVYTSRDTTLPPSLYYRAIHINEVNVGDGTGKKEATITSTVVWLGQSVSVTETLNNWH